ncbi:MAG TPA: N-acetylglucosamine-6-phosphate deacetylase [Candidatus Dormibacteraeota bacterium]|nr:N-acetylglucosamine-6-phosphate deacetylase [Candidatus Dormibacteraeota bacterium]
MPTTLIHPGRALTPTSEIQDAGILIRDDVIEAVGPRSAMSLPAGGTELNASEKTAIPGFIDVHIHGAGGRDMMEASGDALAAVTRKVAEFGTTSLLATTVTASPDDTCRAAAGISQYITRQHKAKESRAEVLGIHFEGPFISKVRRGVHPVEWIQSPSEDLLKRFLQAAEGNARLITIAPEVVGAAPCIEAARKAGLVVSVGHTDANYEQARFAIARGARSATHTYNAMRPFTHRDPGVIGAVLTSPEINAELIADGVHVEEAAMKLLLKAKGHERVILISDGLSATGMPDGKYMLGGFEVTLTNGVCRNAQGILAGSTLTLDRALRNIVNLGVPLADAVRMLTLNPASLLGIEFKKGSLRIGADADVLLLDQSLHIANAWARGLAVR